MIGIQQTQLSKSLGRTYQSMHAFDQTNTMQTKGNQVL